MNQLPKALRHYLICIWLAGLLAWSSSWLLSFDRRPLSWPWLAVLLVALIATESLPQHVLRGVKLSFDTIPLFVAMLCLPVSAAVSMALIGAGVAQVLRRRPWYEAGFNVAVTSLVVFIGGTACAGLMRLSEPWAVPLAAASSATLYYLMNSSLIAGAVAQQHRLPYGRIWQQIVNAEPLDHLLMLLVGGLLALPWAWKPAIAGLLLVGGAVRLMQVRYQKMNVPVRP